MSFFSSLILWIFAPNLCSGILHPDTNMRLVLKSPILKEGTLFLPIMLIKVKGSSPEMRCYMKVHNIRINVEKSMIFL